MKLLSVVGARPQFIKLAPLSKHLEQDPDIEHLVCHTGQHYDAGLSKVFFEQLGLATPEFQFELEAKSPVAKVHQMISQLTSLIHLQEPDWLLVYGDTYSTLAGALSAQLLDVKLAHVEAGLRSYRKDMPEEFNRITSDAAAHLLFCGSRGALENLQRENNPGEAHYCGDIMYQSQQLALRAEPQWPANLQASGSGNYCLVTIHRRENLTEQRMNQWAALLNSLAEDHHIVFPMHPGTRKALDRRRLNPKIQILEPLGYVELCHLLQDAEVLLTDSGGLQKEAYYLHRPCITLRAETEWTELVEEGVNRVTDLEEKRVREALDYFQNTELKFDQALYSDVDSAAVISQAIKKYTL